MMAPQDDAAPRQRWSGSHLRLEHLTERKCSGDMDTSRHEFAPPTATAFRFTAECRGRRYPRGNSDANPSFTAQLRHKGLSRRSGLPRGPANLNHGLRRTGRSLRRDRHTNCTGQRLQWMRSTACRTRRTISSVSLPVPATRQRRSEALRCSPAYSSCSWASRSVPADQARRWTAVAGRSGWGSLPHCWARHRGYAPGAVADRRTRQLDWPLPSDGSAPCNCRSNVSWRMPTSCTEARIQGFCRTLSGRHGHPCAPRALHARDLTGRDRRADRQTPSASSVRRAPTRRRTRKPSGRRDAELQRIRLCQGRSPIRISFTRPI